MILNWLYVSLEQPWSDLAKVISRWWFVCLIWFITSQLTIFQLCWDRSYKFVLLKDTTQWRRWGWNPPPLGLESSTLPLSHCCWIGLNRYIKIRCFDSNFHIPNILFCHKKLFPLIHPAVDSMLYFLFSLPHLFSWQVQSVYIRMAPQEKEPYGSGIRPLGPRREKTCLRGFRQSEFQTSLLSYSD